MSRLHCITPWQGRKPSVLSEERLSPREEKTYVFVRHFLGKKNGGERVSRCNLLNKLKNRIVLLQQPQVWHIMALPPYKSVLTFLGNFRGFSFFYGEEMGMFLNANQPSSEPGVKPTSLIIRRHGNIA
jgi:hypothetical protein